jgi:excisionase family DNA binding protein
MKEEKPNSIYAHYLKVADAAVLIAVSPWTIRKWIKERKIRIYRFGGAVRIRESDLLAFASITPSKRDICERQNIP